jgi:hypothetical protein
LSPFGLAKTLAGATTGTLSRTVFEDVSMIDTVSLFALATKRRDWSWLRIILFGCPPTAILAVTTGVVAPRSTTSTSRSRWLLTYAVVSPLTTTQKGNSPPGTPACASLAAFPGRRSSSWMVLAPSVTTLMVSFS